MFTLGTQRMDVTDDWRRGGVRISAWLYPEPTVAVAGKGARGGRSSAGQVRRYPAQSRAPGSGITVRSMATLSPYGPDQTQGSVRSYLERPEAEPVVLQEAPIEEWLDRWSIWVSAEDRGTGEAVNTDVVAKVLTDELERRYGMLREDVYVVEHGRSKSDSDSDEYKPHVHAVVPALKSMTISRGDMAEIGREIVRALELERALDRTMEMDP